MSICSTDIVVFFNGRKNLTEFVTLLLQKKKKINVLIMQDRYVFFLIPFLYIVYYGLKFFDLTYKNNKYSHGNTKYLIKMLLVREIILEFYV